MSQPPEDRPPQDAADRAEADGDGSRTAYVAIFVAMIGLVGSLSTLLITEFLQQRERRSLEEEQAFVQLANSVVTWEQAVSTIERAIVDLYSTYETVRERDEDGELLEQWREEHRSTAFSLNELDNSFSTVREAREQVYFNADEDGILRAEQLYQAARNRRLYLRYVFGLIPVDPRTRVQEADAAELLAFLDQTERDLVFGEPVAAGDDPSDRQCPDLTSPTPADISFVEVLRSSHACLVKTHLEYIEAVATQIAD